MNIPSRQQCLQILNNNKTPSNVIGHSKAVCKVAEDVVEKLAEKGIKANKELVIAAALLHDVERLKPNHVIAGAKLVTDLGYPEVAEVMSKHTFNILENRPKTIEEKIVFYADKRAKHDKIVSVDERYKDLKERYSLLDFAALDSELEFTKNIEKELLG
ncbi:HD domain-containing protein [Candidatus Woesearchaeota archaeon]|nr:HD domain-containing protein [Candidatus Woesearchaeota archaeon]